jgi:predicted SAM-dependent methyltransferase
MLRFPTLTPRPTATAATPLLNLGCGRRRHPAWTNVDLVPDGPDVSAVDLRQPLPFAAGAFTAAYASHVLEHLPPVGARALVLEIRRVLAPGGVVRLVVPDLEGIARAYLASLDAAADARPDARWRHRWMVVEMLDQLVRTRSGGMMRRWWSCDPVPARELIETRLGAEAREAIELLAAERRRSGEPAVDPATILHDEPAPPRAAARFAARGERHQWMYDRVSLAELLEETGFRDPRRVAANESAIPGFTSHGLDADAAGRPHKPDSLFMEAVRP